MIERDGDTVRIYAARKKALYVFGISTGLTLSMYAFNRMGLTEGAEMDWLLVYCLAFCNIVALGL